MHTGHAQFQGFPKILISGGSFLATAVIQTIKDNNNIYKFRLFKNSRMYIKTKPNQSEMAKLFAFSFISDYYDE